MSACTSSAAAAFLGEREDWWHLHRFWGMFACLCLAVDDFFALEMGSYSSTRARKRACCTAHCVRDLPLTAQLANFTPGRRSLRARSVWFGQSAQQPAGSYWSAFVVKTSQRTQIPKPARREHRCVRMHAPYNSGPHHNVALTVDQMVHFVSSPVHALVVRAVDNRKPVMLRTSSAYVFIRSMTYLDGGNG